MDTDTGKRRRAGDAVKYGDNSIIPFNPKSIIWHIFCDRKSIYRKGVEGEDAELSDSIIPFNPKSIIWHIFL